MPTPLDGDRAAKDSLNYPSLHATDLEAGTPVQHLPDDAVNGEVPVWQTNKWVAQSVSAGPGGGANGVVAIVNWNEVTNQVLYGTSTSEVVVQVSVEVSEIWDGTGATVKVGTDVDDDYFFQTTELDLTELNTYQKFFSFSGDNNIEITFVSGAGASQGQVKVVIETVPMEAS